MIGMQIKEKTINEIKAKLNSMNTGLNKISYLESALKETKFSFEIKRFLLETIVFLYSERKMYDKAARAMSIKAGMEITHKERIESFLSAAELYCETGRVEDADEMFNRATRDASVEDKAKIILAKKNIYQKFAKELEKKNKAATATKFYERLLKMNLIESEKETIKEKLISKYKTLGLFREAKLIEGIR